jgi:diamine N-acetyltransferase
MPIKIRETQKKDLESLKRLWNDGDVMIYVGFPRGLGYDDWQMNNWFDRLQTKQFTKHYSITDDDLDFVGETYFSWEDQMDPAILDIKLFAKARGKQIASRALAFCLDQLFRLTKSQEACVDPNKENLPAVRLYQRLGFQEKHRFIEGDNEHIYMELSRQAWRQSRLDALALREIDRSNYMDILRLKVSTSQTHFVASNAVSLAQAKYQDEMVPKAIYSMMTPVGFLMYCLNPDDQEYWIFRLMIDEHYQGFGYGKRAMELVLDEMKKLANGHIIRISFEPENLVARTLYEQLGFHDTGKMVGDEIVFELNW